jgi:hypothetical protein
MTGPARRSGILGWFAPMRWLMIGLFVSLGALLTAAAGVARHIWRHHHAHPQREAWLTRDRTPESDLELEP